MTACHQFVPALEPGAVGQHTLEVQKTLRDAGVESEVFADIVHPAMVGRARPFEEYGAEFPARRGDWLMYQFAIGSPVANFLRARTEPSILYHHNLTPPEMLAAWEPAIVPGVLWGRRQLVELAGRVDFALAVSHFNRADLVDFGYRDVDVVPILLDLDTFAGAPDPTTRERLDRERARGGADLLFVGRVIPNKCQHDLIKGLAAYRKAYDNHARLHIVGGPASPAYDAALRALARELGVADAVDFAGAVSPAALNAYYRSADVFVSTSVHEGFCVPLLEAMYHRVPVVAYAAAAIPETVGPAGLLLDSKAPAVLAAAWHRVATESLVRTALQDAGIRRLDAFALEPTRRRFLAALERHGVGVRG